MNESMEVVKMSDCERIKENWKTPETNRRPEHKKKPYYLTFARVEVEPTSPISFPPIKNYLVVAICGI